MKTTYTSTNGGGFNPLQLLLVLFLAIALLGCTASKPEVKYLTQVTMLKIPNEFKAVKEIPPPPFTPIQATGMTCDAKLSMLYDYSGELVMDLGVLRKRVNKLADWEGQQLELYSPKTK